MTGCVDEIYNIAKMVRLTPKSERGYRYMDNTDLYSQIVESYKKNGSVKKTAEEFGTSVIRVRRVLITEGLWSSPTSLKILELYNQGFSTQEIAQKLCYTEKNVQAFLPYKRGVYGETQSTDSLRSKEYRERNNQAAENQVGSSENAPKGYVRDEVPVLKEATIERTADKAKNYGKHPVALKVHLELDIDGCNSNELRVLRRYGKMDKSISRDILVPADITLHALHYVIQKLFGWQNGHLHHYSFPEDVFARLTEGKFSKWCSLAGIYFRFPTEEMDDLYWDEDYQPNQSIKSWFKSKYKGPYHYGGLGDYYLENQQLVYMLKHDLPKIEVRESFEEFMKNSGKGAEHPTRKVKIEDVTVDELQRSIDLGGDLNCLLERLTLLEYLHLPDNTYFLDDIDDKVRFLEEGLGSVLEMWNNALKDIDNQYEMFCQLAALTTVRMQAQSNEIKYFYDYGDGWEIAISLTDVYYREDLVLDEESNTIKVLKNYSPMCLAADGLPMVEDVGGIGGYVEFLQTIHDSEDENERADAREWARSLGWTGRMIKPQNIL